MSIEKESLIFSYVFDILFIHPSATIQARVIDIPSIHQSLALVHPLLQTNNLETRFPRHTSCHLINLVCHTNCKVAITIPLP